MNIEKRAKYFFENDFIHYKSLINDFTDEIYDQFDEIAQKVELSNRIDDLISQMNISEKAGLVFFTIIGINEDGSLLEAPNFSETPRFSRDRRLRQ